MNDQIIRQHQILRFLPRHPRSVTINRLKDLLLDQGIEVNARTLQRDMNTLSEVFIGIDSIRNPDNSQSWFWSEDAPVLQLSGLTINQALSFYLVKQYLTPLLPSITLEELKPFFDQAESTLDAIHENKIAKWSKKIAVVSPTQPLKPPRNDETVNKTVRHALLGEKQLDILYKRGDDTILNYQINPIGLVVRNIVTYLIATKVDTSEIRMFSFHRILEATELPADADIPPTFDIQDYIDEGHLGFNVTGESDINTFIIKLLFDKSASKHLQETPLSTDQTIEEVDDETTLVRATVRENEQLLWWILSFGDHVTVLKPLHLQEKIADIASRMTDNYQFPGKVPK